MTEDDIQKYITQSNNNHLQTIVVIEPPKGHPIVSGVALTPSEMRQQGYYKKVPKDKLSTFYRGELISLY